MIPSLFKSAAMRPASARVARLGMQVRGNASVVSGSQRASPLESRRSTAPSFERATFTIRVRSPTFSESL